MEILIKQSIDSLREDLGYDEWDDENDEGLLFKQGYDGFVIEVEDGERFEIPEEHEGQILDDSSYFIKIEDWENSFERQEVVDLQSGIYRLDGDLIIRAELY